MDTQDSKIYLTTATDSVEADLIESMLHASGVLTTRKYRETSGYLNIFMGNAKGSIDIYVPMSSREKAVNIVRPYPDAAPADTDYDKDDIDYGIEKKKYKYRKILILLAFLPSLIGFFVYIIYRLFVR